MKRVASVLLILMMIFSLAGCTAKVDTPAVEAPATDVASTEAPAATDPKTDQLIIYCPHPLEFIDPIVNEFESTYGIQVEVIAAGTGELLTRVEAESSDPLGDVMWGGSMSTLEPKKEFFEPYQSENEGSVYPEYKNEDGFITRFTTIPSVIMINKNLIGDIKIEGYEDLLNPALKGKIANADPSKSSSSFEQVINQLYAMGNGTPDAGWAYVEKFIANLDGKLLSGSSAVYKGVADGEYSVGLTFEEGAAKYVKDGAPVEIVYPVEGTITKADGVAIIKGAKNIGNAKLFINFVTSQETQTLIANELNRRSVRTDVGAAEGLKELNDIFLISDDAAWSTENKQNILDQYKDIFTK